METPRPFYQTIGKYPSLNSKDCLPHSLIFCALFLPKWRPGTYICIVSRLSERGGGAQYTWNPWGHFYAWSKFQWTTKWPFARVCEILCSISISIWHFNLKTWGSIHLLTRMASLNLSLIWNRISSPGCHLVFPGMKSQSFGIFPWNFQGVLMCIHWSLDVNFNWKYKMTALQPY